MMRKSCCIYATGIIATHLLIVGIALMIADVFPGLMTKRLKGEITLTEGSKVFDSWKNPPPPVFMEFFFFNVTNPDEYLAGLAKPRVVEVGPYTYREYRSKENVTFVANGTKVAAYTPKTFVFLPEKSKGNPEVDLITSVNVPAVAVMNKVQGSFFITPAVKAWMKMLNITGILTTRTVSELLWGYEDPLLKKVSALKKDVEKDFGFMINKNGSHDGEFVYLTGEEDYLDYGRVDTWKGQRKLTYWGSNYSNLIQGSDGSAFHAYLTKEETLNIFTPDLCRSIYMKFDKDVEVKGIPAYRFTPPRSVLASVEENPDNAGFCLSSKNCLGSGVLKVDVCKKGVPVVVSFPHFYLGADDYINAIDGISPVKEHHQTYLDLNPTTGIIVRASKRAQFNILVERLSSFPITSGLDRTVFPLFFLNETVVVDDASAARLHKLLLIVKIGSNFPIFIIALGALLVIILLILIIRLHKKKIEVKRFDFSEAYPYLPTTAKEDTIYSPVNDKTEDYSDNSKNGNYVGMTPVKAERA
ncbi:lysosome membrane protein 2 isoform X1 [Alosa pseudoharengus]|uniref:lysosome membrane protein 2 isoform X1 n=1 Tax=Alosa pseudoharengus TaxID=34774 RepID=UPI003F894BE5